MTTPAITVQKHLPLDEIARLFEARSISAAPVLSDRHLVGVVSTTDLVRCLPEALGTSLTAATLMSTPPIMATPDEPLDEAARRLVAGRIHRLIVAEGDHAVGILSAHDILEEVLTRRVTSPIRSIMTVPVETLDIGESIEKAIRRLAETNVHGLVVVDGAAPVGVFTHREAIAARMLTPELRKHSVEEVMSYETICLDVDTPIFRAAAYGMAMNVRRFLAVEHRRLAGILSSIDLVGVLARAPEA